MSFLDGGRAGGDPITGTYISKRNDYGATKFLADGRVVTSSTQGRALGLAGHGPQIETPDDPQESARLGPP